MPKVLIFDRDFKFTFAFWKTLFTSLEVEVQFSTPYHAQMDGKTKRLNEVLKDKL